MDDLAAWLTQIWDEQEKAAQEARDATLHTPWAGPVITQHMTLNNPTVVLAWIAADRQILALHAARPIRRTRREEASGRPLRPGDLRVVCDECSGDDDPYIDQVAYPCETVRLLALPYADRVGYREEWRPVSPSQPESEPLP